MDDEQIAQVRRFNRTVTQRVGALDDRVPRAATGRSAQARVLWEIGPDGAELRALRARLGLDSGLPEPRSCRRSKPTGWSPSSPSEPTGACGRRA